jgi:hypothetical protein
MECHCAEESDGSGGFPWVVSDRWAYCFLHISEETYRLSVGEIVGQSEHFVSLEIRRGGVRGKWRSVFDHTAPNKPFQAKAQIS